MKASQTVVCAVTVAQLIAAAGALSAQQDVRQRPLVEYRDPQGRFAFSYPRSFGVGETGTNSGFGGRVAAVRFTRFSGDGVGGEAVVMRLRVLLDVQALGGLYDPFVREQFPPPLLLRLDAMLPSVTGKNLCELLARPRHVSPDDQTVVALPAAQRAALIDADSLGNVTPQLVTCVQEGDTVTFHKTAAVTARGRLRHIIGAVRFLPAPYSAFHVIQARSKPDTSLMPTLAAVVRSWTAAVPR